MRQTSLLARLHDPRLEPGELEQTLDELNVTYFRLMEIEEAPRPVSVMGDTAPVRGG